eukprot:468318_1
MSVTCSTASSIPFWVTIGFFGAAFIMLIVTSYYSYQHVKSTHNKPINSSNKRQDKVDKSNKLHNTHNEKEGQTEHTTSTNKQNKTYTCKCLIKSWLFDISGRKSIYLPLILHLMDTATDFSAIAEFYHIGSNTTPKDCGDLNIWWLFILSVTAMLAYRLISSYTIWRITAGNWKRVAMQLIDIELFEVLYISHRLKLKRESSPQRLLDVLEAIFEAAPQSMIQMIYLLKTGNLSGIVFLSSILSFIFLTFTIINDDKKFLNKFSKCTELITLYLFRICDIP